MMKKPISIFVFLTALLQGQPSWAVYFPPNECIDMAFNTADAEQSLQTVPDREAHTCRLTYSLVDKASARVLYERDVQFSVLGPARRAGAKVFWGALTPIMYGVDSALVVAGFAASVLTWQNPLRDPSDHFTNGLGSLSRESYRKVVAYCSPADVFAEDSASRKFTQATAHDQYVLSHYERACATEEGRLRGLGQESVGEINRN